MEDAEVNDVVIEWTCQNCNNSDEDKGLNRYNSDDCMGKITDTCEDCGEEFRLN